MSRRVLERVARTRGIPAAQKMVLIVLAQHAHDDGTNAYPSQETIADLAGMTPRSVRRCLAGLEAAGRIVPVAHGGNGRHTVNYSIRLDMLADNPDNMSAFTSPNPDNMSALQDDNPDNSAHKGGHFRQVRRTNTTDNPDNMSAEYGKNKDKNKEEESAEHADDARASRVPLSSSQKKGENTESGDQSEESEPTPRGLLAPFTDDEIDAIMDPETEECNQPCTKRREVLYAFWEAIEHYNDEGAPRTPQYAWLQYTQIFIETGATPDEIMTGYYLMRDRAEEQHWEHLPGVKYLATHWEEWHSAAKLRLAEYAAEERRSREAAEAAERERTMWEERRLAREAEDARRAALTPEERSAEDAEIAAEVAANEEERRQRWEANKQKMKAATAPIRIAGVQ